MRTDIENITIYEVEYEVKTPLKIDKEYLPGNTIRGAVLTRLFERYGFDVRKESREPSLIFHPAFPIDQESKQTYKPAHPFVFKCKICGSISDSLDYGKSVNWDDISPLFQNMCTNNHIFSLKSLGGKLVAKKDQDIAEYKEKRVSFYSVGINKILGSSEINMLYHSTYIVPGTRFRGIIVSEDSVGIPLDKIDNIIYLGRGSSRGFGHTLIKIRKVEDYISKRRDMIRDMIKDSYILLRALSPVFDIELTENGLASTTNIKVDGIGVKGIVSTRITKISGFSLLSNIQKVKLYGLGEGSILSLDTKDYSRDYLTDKLIRLELFGIGPFSAIGFNIVEVLG